MYIDNFKKIIDSYFVFFQKNKRIIVAKKGRPLYYLNDEHDILLDCDIDAAIKGKDLFNHLLDGGIKNEELALFVARRARKLIGEEIITYGDKGKYTTFCNNPEFASMYGIENPEKVKLTVLETFDSNKLFNMSRPEQNIVFGFWDIDKDKINTSFIYKSPIQTQVCFADFGENELLRGSLFLKMSVEAFKD